MIVEPRKTGRIKITEEDYKQVTGPASGIRSGIEEENRNLRKSVQNELRPVIITHLQLFV